MSEKRKDKRGRILKTGETQDKKTGRYKYTYYEDGKQNLLKYADTESEPEIYLLRDNHYYDPFGETEETEEAQITGEAAEGTEPEADEPADEAAEAIIADFVLVKSFSDTHEYVFAGPVGSA